MPYPRLVCVRKIYEIKYNCTSCGETKGNRFIVISVDQANFIRFNGYFCSKCIPQMISNFDHQNYNTVPFFFIKKLMKLNKIIVANGNEQLNKAINDILNYSKKTKKSKRI